MTAKRLANNRVRLKKAIGRAERFDKSYNACDTHLVNNLRESEFIAIFLILAFYLPLSASIKGSKCKQSVRPKWELGAFRFTLYFCRSFQRPHKIFSLPSVKKLLR